MWKTEIIVPLKKKGDGKKTEDYSGVTLLNTMYKIYMMVLEDRLEREMEEKGMLPHSQVGFRKGMSAIDNIYILNYAVNREKQREGEGIWALFVDIKSAFDSVDGGYCGEHWRRRG